MMNQGEEVLRVCLRYVLSCFPYCGSLFHLQIILSRKESHIMSRSSTSFYPTFLSKHRSMTDRA